MISELIIVSLDVCGTLIDYTYFDYIWNEVIPTLYAKKHNQLFNEAKRIVLHEYDRVGKNDVRWYLPAYWFNFFNLSDSPHEVFKQHSNRLDFYPDAPSVIEKLGRKHVLITSSGVPLDIQEIVLLKFRRFFTHPFSSISRFQEIKKTLRFYRMICQMLDILPNQLYHVGDDLVFDLIIPRKLGINAFLLDRETKNDRNYVLTSLVEFLELIENI